MKLITTGSNLPTGKIYTGGRGFMKTADSDGGSSNVSSFPSEWFSPLLSFRGN